MQIFSTQKLKQTMERGITKKADDATQSIYRSSHQLWILMQLAWGECFDVYLP